MKYLMAILWFGMSVYWYQTEAKEACALAAGISQLWVWKNEVQ